MQVSLDIFESIVPENELIMEIDVRIDRGSRYSFAYTKVEGKKDIEKFLKTVRQQKPFNSADHNSYAFRMKSPDGVLVEGKGDDGESGAGLCILREMRRGEIEQCCIIVARHF